jgi:chromosome partitioning protein
MKSVAPEKRKPSPYAKADKRHRQFSRAIFSFGGTLESLDATNVSNIDAAIKNARELAGEIITLLRQNAEPTAHSELAQEVA